MSVSKPSDQMTPLPEHFSVAVIMQKGPSVSAWSEVSWQALGIAVSQDAEESSQHKPRKIHEEADVSHYLYPNYRVKLYADECESYYHNIMSPNPRCFVVAVGNEQEVPVPFLVSLSFDEANAYLEADETVYDVDLPPELYRWAEAFVLAHYVPEKKTKRRRIDWKVEQAGVDPS